ncbi:2-oxoglutarate decarboxylase [Gracilibacillus halophilus YIM-C55.5]|uniref:2-succinyl-5-enolpyruvyl-6-hydroxy-3-cyclohexene-1-carboxylate synthase n=1 Tax=Gracilibacillus halophilus YIM-C55.5 TaxID=1308866 RepID=N4WA08_9BACI|nr:2-succinyl-5-enolpyruvyl-6-hydroxy-3-cyclohexene-1-carboxylic-acid synthase [Gracilibacillus halophilus]ENH97118.1 2-oxoglutarate decarboxylase [Gracilibacillus halophilus YIM-C55.5]
MVDQIALTKYVGHFIQQLYLSGVEDVVISPGSRSTPLALTMAEHQGIRTWIDIDERSAGFFALGIAKANQQAVALVCSSGTAAANYFPAVIEARQSRIPLVVLTADRPHELRDVGAPQAIDQIKLYGDYTKWFHEMALPEASTEMLQYAKNHANRAVSTAVQPHAGPVHLNFPFREPLIPDFSLDDIWGERDVIPSITGDRFADESQLRFLLSKIADKQRGIMICGPHDSHQLPEALVHLAEAWNIPILADPLSQLRSFRQSQENVIDAYDSFLRSEAVRDQLAVDFVVRFGAMPVSKSLLQFIKRQDHITQIIVDDPEGYREPALKGSSFIFAAPPLVAKQLTDIVDPLRKEWLNRWKMINQTTKNVLHEETTTDRMTEGQVMIGIQQQIPDDSILYVGNSMPIRDVDTFWQNQQQSLSIYANRGANGIDGMLSSALGASAKGQRVTLVIGDVSMLHSLNGLLLARHYDFDLTIVLVNNDGGGIFSFLPQANMESEHYEALFGTPTMMDFENLARAYSVDYEDTKTWDEFVTALSRSYQTSGISLIEVQTDRSENVQWHREKWRQVEQKLLS